MKIKELQEDATHKNFLLVQKEEIEKLKRSI